MSDQQAPLADTPADAGPEGAPGPAEQQGQTQAEIDWQKRYADLQPEYTRTSQEAAQLREAQQLYELALTADDPDTRRQALEALGYQLPEDEEQPLSEDPYDALAQRQEAFEQRLTQREQQEEESRQTELIRSITDERLGQLPELDEADQDWILAYAINALPALHEPGVPVPLPDVKQAYDVFVARETERQRNWAKTKRGAPYIPGDGQTATEVPNLDTHQGRMDFAARKLAEMQES